MTLHRIDFTPELLEHLRVHGVSGITPGLHKVDDASLIETPVNLSHAYVWDTPVEISAFTYLGYEAQVSFARIGRYCSIAKLVQIGLDNHPTDWLTSSALAFMRYDPFEDPFRYDDHAWERTLPITDKGEAETRTTIIGNDVWIGCGVVVRDGVTIGDGAVIGANAMVTRDVPPYAVVAGAPARVIRMRFPDALIERMQAVRWWRYNILDLAIDPRDPERALDAIEAAVAAGLQPYAPIPLNLAGEARRFHKAQRKQAA
jgi:acetyltransferase-like isoleucine patch superfamily enzyme